MRDGSEKVRALRRSNAVGIIIVAIFGVLLLRILFIQTVDFSEYQKKVIDQMTSESPVAANRGKIFDKNGNILATNITTYKVFIDPSSIVNIGKEEGKNYTKIVAKGLSDFLENVTYEYVTEQITNYSNKSYRAIRENGRDIKLNENEAAELREFIVDNSLETMVYVQAQSTRYYPSETLAAHVIGFTSEDGNGLYGLELKYDDELSGADGYYIRARDSYGNVMPFEYASYIDAIDGWNLTTTLDSTIQSYLEAEIAATVEKHEVTNRACGIIMDVNTGAILAMATSSPFDLNNPRELDEQSMQILEAVKEEGYLEDSQEYNDISLALRTTMWSNKAVTESYIPGSTFKIITSSMALEEKLVSREETENCPGYRTLYGHKIHCHATAGHGTITFETGLQQSCNVWFMELGGRLGVQKYKNYVEMFGYTERTGIDLPGEGSSIFAAQMSELDLAIYAFGQNFNVTPIQQLTAIASVANGGTLVTPYIVEKITDNAGNVKYQHELQTKRGTVSSGTSQTVSDILEKGVSNGGGAKNAYVAGYRVAAKTGTAEKKERECPKCGYTGIPAEKVDDVQYFVCSVCGFKGDEEYFEVSEKYICSTVAYAPADDPQIAIIIMVDEPTRGSLYGSTVAAPYVANVLENTMPYLGIEAQYSEADRAKLTVKVGSYRGWSIGRATEYIEDRGLKVVVVGEPEEGESYEDLVVTSQLPASGEYIDKSSGTIYLYAGVKPEATVSVPLLEGENPTLANRILAYRHLNIKIEGEGGHSTGTEYKVVYQSIPAGTLVPEGTVITVRFEKVRD